MDIFESLPVSSEAASRFIAEVVTPQYRAISARASPILLTRNTSPPFLMTEVLPSSTRSPFAIAFANSSGPLTGRDNVGEIVRSSGMSHIPFNSSDQVVLHQDYWDCGSGLFEHISVVGWLIRRIKARL